MERTRLPGEETEETRDRRILWKKTNGGFFRMPNRIIKQNQEFWATPEEIPIAFRDTIIPVNAQELEEIDTIPAEKIPAVEVEYTIRDNSDGTFDITDKQGKVINEKPLKSQKKAEELLKAWKA